MSRIGPIGVDHMSPEMRREWEILTAWRPPRDGLVGGPYDAWLRSPELLHRLQGIGGFIWERTSLDRGLVEYLIALTSRHWACNIEWSFHRARAIEHGVAPAILDALLAGHPPPTDRPDIRYAHAAASALLAGHSLGDHLYAEGTALLGERGTVEIAAITGYYSLVAFTLRLFEIEPAPGAERPFARPPDAPH